MKIEECDLVSRYSSSLDSTFRKKFVTRWDGPFRVTKKFKNGSYQLEGLDGKRHKNRVNGFRLKEFFAKTMHVSGSDPIVMKQDDPEDVMDEDTS